VASAPSTASRTPHSVTQAPDAAPQDPQPAVDVTAITSRDDFLLELGEALGGQASVRPVETLEEALSSMSAGKRAQLLVIDARALAEVRAAVEIVQAQAPRAAMLVFAEDAAERELAAALKGSKVFAVLSTAIEPRKTQAVLEGAIAEALAARPAGVARAAPPLQPELTIGAFRPQSAAQAARPARSALARGALLAAAAAVVALGTLAFWYFTRGSAPQAAPAAPPSAAAGPSRPDTAPAPAPSNFLVEGKLDELLEKARTAMHQRHYSEPSGDNALLYYRSAAAVEPTNAEALDGLQRVAAVLAGRLEEELNAGHLDEAAQTLANLKAASSADPRLAAFEQRLYAAQFAKALADNNAERAAAVVRQAQQAGSVSADQLARWRAELVRHQDDAKVQKLAALADERIHDGQLTDANDGAGTYVQQLLAAAPAHPATARAVHDLTAAYLKKAREAALAKNSADEERWLNAARGLGMKPADIAAFQRELAGARQKALQAETDRQLQLARAALHDGRLTEPAQDSAAAYLSQLQAADAGNAALPELGRELAGKLLERARAALQAGRSADADLAQAKHWGADPKDLLAVQQLAAPQPKADPATLAAALKRLRAPPPDYPPAALASRISGSVTVEFTVSTAGEPHDVHVVEATPPGVFDQAAVSAVRHWRYVPLLVDGAAVEVPVRTRMRFELPK
jgi:TonB family protein